MTDEQQPQQPDQQQAGYPQADYPSGRPQPGPSSPSEPTYPQQGYSPGYSQPEYSQPGYPSYSGEPYPTAQYPSQQYPTQQYPTYPLYGAPYAPPSYQGPAGPGGPGGPGEPGGRSGGQSAPRRTVLIAAAVAAIVGGGIGAGTGALAGHNSNGSSAGLTFSRQEAPAAKTDGTITAAAKKIGPSVVTITVTTSQEQDTGSGVIIRADGYILTNNHVISTAVSNSAQIQVAYSDGTTSTAQIVGTDPSDDLAVIKVSGSGLTAASFASSSALQVGQTVVAVGAPLGLSDTVTAGIVSNLARPVTTSDSNNDQAWFNAIQTDAAINPGNSGGPLVNLNGDVVGINAAIATDQSQGGLQVPNQESGNIGIGFAIPSDEASRIAGELIKTGKATHAVIGVSVGSNPNGLGAVISKIVAGSAAAHAGLQEGDVIIKLDDQRIDDSNDLVAAVRSHAPGQQVTVTYTRSGDTHTVSLTLGSGTD